MRCEDFENLFSEFGSTDHSIVRLHLDDCPQCAARLSDERVLDVGLQAFAGMTAQASAPENIKRELLAAFKQQQEPEKMFSSTWMNAWRWELSAATALILLTLIIGLAFWYRSAPISIVNKSLPESAESAKNFPAGGEVSKQEVKPTGSSNDAKKQSVIKNNRVRTHRPVRRKFQESENKLTRETRTEFFPLTYATDTKALQNAMVMRVEVPKTTLIAMGLPINERHANELIKAEVMMGDDGVAYAIRLIQ